MIVRVALLTLFSFLNSGNSDPLSFAESEDQIFSADAFTFNELTTRADRFPVRAGERACVTCQVASDLLEPFCPSAGIFSHFVSCRDYFICDEVSADPVVLTCPAGQLFDKSIAKCENSGSVQCSGNVIDFGSRQNDDVISYRSQTPRINLRPTRPSQQGGLFSRNDGLGFFNTLDQRADSYVCLGLGLFRDPEDCAAFYSCYAGGKGRMSCPAGLYFNEGLGVCDYSSNVQCVSVVGPPTVPLPTEPPTAPTFPTDATATVQPTTAPDTSLKRVCYYTNWARYRPEPGMFLPADIDKYFCTHLIYAFAVLDQNTFLMKAHDPWADFDLGGYRDVTQFREKGLKVLLAIGGWTDSAGSKYSELVANKERRAAFISHAITFLKDNNFDGLDLDWEFPRCWQSSCIGPVADKVNFVLFVKELRIAFNNQNPPLLLTAAVSANPNIAGQAYDIGKLSIYLDFFNLMAYDYHGSWEGKTGHVAPLSASDNDSDRGFNVKASVEFYLTNGAERSKIVVGFPTYGRSFTLNDPSRNGYNAPASAGAPGSIVREAGTLSYTEICIGLRKGGWTKVNGTDSVGPHAFSGNQWVSYLDVEAVSKFAYYVLEENLGGAMVWALDFDDFNADCCSISSPLMSTIERAFTGVGPAIHDIISQCSYPGIDAANLPVQDITRPVNPTDGGVQNPDSVLPSIAEVDGVDCSNPDNPLQRDPESCNHFYSCVDLSYPVRMKCPSNLVWHDDMKYCDWQRNVVCTLSN